MDKSLKDAITEKKGRKQDYVSPRPWDMFYYRMHQYVFHFCSYRGHSEGRIRKVLLQLTSDSNIFFQFSHEVVAGPSPTSHTDSFYRPMVSPTMACSVTSLLPHTCWIYIYLVISSLPRLGGRWVMGCTVRDVKYNLATVLLTPAYNPISKWETPKNSLDFRKLYFKTDLKMCLLMYFYIPSRVLSVLIITIRMIEQ